jgi:hypothetical protein
MWFCGRGWRSSVHASPTRGCCLRQRRFDQAVSRSSPSSTIGRRSGQRTSVPRPVDCLQARVFPGRMFGGVAEWLGKGLQNPVHRFNSGPRLDPSEAWSSIGPQTRALSSGVERFLDAEEVRGSNPLAPTRTALDLG